MKRIFTCLLLLFGVIIGGCDFMAKQSAEGYYIAEATNAEKQKNYHDAISYFTKAIAVEPKDPAAYMERGWDELTVQDTTAALADINKAIQIKPDIGEGYNLRGLIETGQHKLDTAVADFDKAILLKPKFAYAYNNKCYAHYLKHDTLQAFKDNSTSISLDSINSWAYVYRGLMKLEFHHDTTGAMNDYHKAITKPHPYARAYFEIGKLLIDKGDKESACNYFHTAKDSGYKASQQYCP